MWEVMLGDGGVLEVLRMEWQQFVMRNRSLRFYKTFLGAVQVEEALTEQLVDLRLR